VPNIRSEYFRITGNMKDRKKVCMAWTKPGTCPTYGTSRPSTENSSRLFIIMLHLHGTREDTKMWAKIIFAHAKKCRRIQVSVADGRWVGQKGENWTDLSGHERVTGRFEVRRAYEYSAESTAQYPWVLWGSLEEQYANLWSTRGHSGAITPMKIVNRAARKQQDFFV